MATAVLPLNPENATAALAEACDVAGLDPAGAELIRLGENAVFRLRAAPVIARVGRSAERSAFAEREVAVARWLAREDVPAVKALDIDQPITVDGRVVTFWESASERQEYGTTAELAALLRQLHALTPPMELPPLDVFTRARERIEHAEALGPDDRTFLRDRCARLTEAYDSLVFQLPPGVIHGDANVGNVFRDRHGQALLGDLDGFVIGPREWDLALTAIYYERFGWHTEQEYRTFIADYGCDVMDWSGYTVMRDVRELLMVTWLAQNAFMDDHAKEELNKRIRSLLAGDGYRAWRPL